MKSEKKILLTTAYRKGSLYDYFGVNTRVKFFRFTSYRLFSSGLRFIKQNVPGIEILEYPTWSEYRERIRKGNYDIAGFSFYIHEIPHVLEMIEFARANGVKEIWGGNYGILTKPIQKHFDKIFIGYAEHDVAKALGRKIGRIRHPPLVFYIGTPAGLKRTTV